MSLLGIVGPAIDRLCEEFARGGFNPTPIIDLGVLVASADGEVDQRERRMLSDVFSTLLQTTLPPEVVDALLDASLDVIRQAGAEARARLVGTILKDCHAGEPGVVVALAVAFASEGLSTAERAVVERIANAAGVDRAALAQLEERVRKLSGGDPVSVRHLLATGNEPG